MDNMWIYVLFFPTILNTILLLIMVVALYKLVSAMGNLTSKLESFLVRSEEELFTTAGAFRELATQGANLLQMVMQIADSFFYTYSMRQSPFVGQKLPQILSGLSVGWDLFNFIKRLFKRDKANN
ncbi:MAG: hypothetical protein GX364_02170 [Firmicutes bacterium]|jgi:hypothetical protein|nr:hypothetical protein [Bacillota bacterium]